MKPIKWRNCAATVDGVIVSQHTIGDCVMLFAGTRVALRISLPASAEDLDAAAYALANLVATLRGME